MADAGRGLAKLPFKNPVSAQASAGYLAVIDKEKCNLCGECVAPCPFNAISLEQEYAVVNPELCTGCGVCRPFCSEEAFELKKDRAGGVLPMDIHELVPETGLHS